MAKLPTKEDLEKLYHEKGRDALVWYAWRNALRALPSLGLSVAERIWPKNTVRHVVAVCRISLVLSQWTTAPKQAVISSSSSSSAAAAAAAADAAYAADALAATYAYASAYAYAYASAYASAADAADADYKLLGQANVLMPGWWCRQPLWISEQFGLVEGEPANIKQWRQAFDQQLRELGLDFLADDLHNLWENRPLGAHAINYLKEFSDSELNDPVALRRLILEGETAEHIHAVRALLLGPGGAGKSSLADRLQGKPVEQGKKLTVGVDYLNHQPLNLYDTFDYLQQGAKSLDLYLWDFGGQTIFHGLHSAFLHENCVYVLVVDSRHEQAPDEWLHQIRHLAGGQAKVLLVTNWYETCETHQNEARLLREFDGLLSRDSFFYFSCHEPQAPGLQTFVQALEKACLESQRMVLKETLDVNKALQQQYQDDVFLDSSKLEGIIERITRRPESVETLPNKLEQLGFLVRVDSDDQHYCLKPAWAVDNAYAVLYSPLLREAKGVLTLKALQRAFKGKIEAQYIAYLVEFLQERSLCHKLATGDGYFFPDAARADEQPEASKLLTGDAGLVIRFDLPYLPLGFHARLVHKLFNPHSDVGIRQTDDIWRQGFILRTRNAQAVVQYLLRKGSIEMVMVGELQEFATLLNAFYLHLKEVVVSPNGIRLEQIHPFVSGETQQLFSVHSAEALVKVLGQINSYDQLFQEVRKMASTGNINVTNGQVIIGDHNTQKSHSDNVTTTVTADQRQIISSVLDEMLSHKATLPDDALEAVYDLRKMVRVDEKQPTEKTQSVLAKFLELIKGSAELTENTNKITDFVIDKLPVLATAATTAAAWASSQFPGF